MFTGLGECYCICAKSSIKPFVAPEEAACNLVKCLQWCVGSTRFFIGPALHSCNTVGFVMDSLKTNVHILYSRTREIPFLFHTFILYFNTRHLRYPQCNWDTKWHHWRQSVRLHAASSGTTKGFILLNCFYHICSHTKHTVMCKIGKVTL